MTKLLFGSLALLLVSGAAYAEDQKPDSNDPEKMVCKSQRDLESRIPKKKVCKTRAQWDAEARAAQEQHQLNNNNRAAIGANN